VLLSAAGCSDTTSGSAGTQPAKSGNAGVSTTHVVSTAGDHAHKPGTHGGLIVEIGRDNYHAEGVFEKGGKVRLYLLGNDEAKVQEVELQTLTAYAKAEAGTESSEFLLQPDRRDDDSAGKTSRFAGTLPKELQGKAVEVTVPSIRVAGERFRFSFSSAAEAHVEGSPAGVEDEVGRKLYLTPGGAYTADDIKANGNVTAQQKYKDFKATHDNKPAAGEKICPVTLTKANPECTWVVGGKTYQFCCPPCIDEFVSTARENPALIREPQDYVKKK
jgi:hypothetical protein